MSDEDKESKTEEASDKRQEELREEGKVAQSHDVVSAASLIALCAALASTVSQLAVDLSGLATRSLRLSDAHDVYAGVHASVGALTGMLPALIAAAAGAIAAGIAQTKGLFSIDLAMPKLERLDPTSRFMALLPGKDMATELGKSLLKISAVGIVIYSVVDGALPTLLVLAPKMRAQALQRLGPSRCAR